MRRLQIATAPNSQAIELFGFEGYFVVAVDGVEQNLPGGSTRMVFDTLEAARKWVEGQAQGHYWRWTTV